MKTWPLMLTLSALSCLASCGSGGAGNISVPVVAPVTMKPSPSVAPLPVAGVPAGWKLVWSDEFNTDGLPDARKWDYDTARNKAGWYNDELQYYARERADNARVADGKLIITALKEKLTGASDYGGQAYTSARLLTRGKADWTYGFFEIRAKLPCGLGTWPAIWMLGQGADWPLVGEIDIMEHVGKKPGEVLGTVHTAAFNHTIGTQKGATTTVPDACGAFHNYQLKWDADQLAIGVDGSYFFHFVNAKDGDLRKWPFSAPQHLLLNVAIGGQLGGPVDDAIFPVRMEVDYVRVYQP